MTTLSPGPASLKHMSEMITLADPTKARHESICSLVGISASVGDVPSTKHQHPKYPLQDPYPHRKPGNVSRVSPDFHSPRPRANP